MLGYVIVFFLTAGAVAFGSGVVKAGFGSFGDSVLKALGMLVLGIAICAATYYGVSHFWAGPAWPPIAGVLLGLMVGLGA